MPVVDSASQVMKKKKKTNATRERSWGIVSSMTGRRASRLIRVRHKSGSVFHVLLHPTYRNVELFFGDDDQWTIVDLD
jgi:hypothetical protein